MNDHIYRKYPDHVEAIRALRNKDFAFSEMCDDYEEMCTWLAAQSCTLAPHAEECFQAQEIIRDLEEDIKKALRDAGQ